MFSAARVRGCFLAAWLAAPITLLASGEYIAAHAQSLSIDLSVSRNAPEECRAGAACAVSVMVTNASAQSFRSEVRLSDVALLDRRLDVAAAVTLSGKTRCKAIAANSPPDACLFDLHLEAGATVRIDYIVEYRLPLPEGFRFEGRACTAVVIAALGAVDLLNDKTGRHSRGPGFGCTPLTLRTGLPPPAGSGATGCCGNHSDVVTGDRAQCLQPQICTAPPAQICPPERVSVSVPPATSPEPVAVQKCTDGSFTVAPHPCPRRCRDGRYARGKEECVKLCSGGKTVAEDAECPPSYPEKCPDGSLARPGAVCPGKIPGWDNLSPGIRCPDGSYVDDARSCMKRCSDGRYIPSGERCLRICPDGTHLPEDALCPKRCRDGRYADGDEGCVKLCPGGKSVPEDAECPPSYPGKCPDGSLARPGTGCPDKIPGWDDLSPGIRCPAGSYADNTGNCMKRCLDGRSIPGGEHCLKTCPDGTRQPETVPCRQAPPKSYR